MIDEYTEKLINRRVDGELTERESLELDKRLIRCPQARALMEEYQRSSELAGETLRNVFPQAERADSSERLVQAVTPRRASWRIVPTGAAVAAAVFLGLLVGQWAVQWLTPPAVSRPTGGDVNPPITIAEPAPTENGSIMVQDGPRHREQRIVRDVFGVFDEETQSVYLLEASPTHTSLAPVSANY